jgi:hypothetical protein
VDTSVRRINRRAALVLIPAALALATIMGILATAPAGLWLLAYTATYGLAGLVAFEGAHALRQLGRRWASRGAR